jgi:transcriptional regulator with XRE-family HTH domain
MRLRVKTTGFNRRKGGAALSAGKELKKLRQQRGLTIRDVVKASGGMLDKTTVSRIERDERGLSLKAAYCFSKIFNISMETLFELLHKKKVPQSAIPFDASPQEREFLTVYRTLSIRHRRMVGEIVKAVAILGDFPSTEDGRMRLLKELKQKK